MTAPVGSFSVSSALSFFECFNGNCQFPCHLKQMLNSLDEVGGVLIATVSRFGLSVLQRGLGNHKVAFNVCKISHLVLSFGERKVRAARVSAARLRPSKGQEPQRLIGGVWMLFTPEHFANAVGVRSEHLNDVCKRYALLSVDVGCNSIIKIQRAPFDRNYVELDTCDRVFREMGETPLGICHGFKPPMAYETLDEGRNSSSVGYDGSLDETPSLCAGSANHRRSSNTNYISAAWLPEPQDVRVNRNIFNLCWINKGLRAALARLWRVCASFSPKFGTVHV
ncbi:hypothetical protein [Ruegeria sp. Ofav3-42]|uniref:hypothetical protein n=1 Tax=Ruegeria sp. Ofav3-42 TaxID=2917759 RepID=UPI001EF5D34B|nr:hypothetical protein [Ruegeria sp. Ofav3-42]MCG7520867.1 hypothetical protein [Ruegeria sp. Ofav3-42]